MINKITILTFNYVKEYFAKHPESGSFQCIVIWSVSENILI